MLYLDHLALDKIEIIDSVKLDAQGEFSFNPVAPKECFDFYRLRIDGKVINLSIDSTCLLYTSPSPRDKRQCRMPSSA